MKKIKEGLIKLKELKATENSRLRGNDDVSDLMHDIEQHGLLEPIGVRLSDNAIIFGNRRVKAFEKLGYTQIPCMWFDDVEDTDLLVLNVVENLKRKDICSIEIGRMCKLLEDDGLKRSEIAVKLGIRVGRVISCISAYEVTKGTPFEKLVKFGSGREEIAIHEGVIWKVQTTLTRALPGHKITKEQWKLLLPAIEKGKLTTKNVTTLRGILCQDISKDLNKALDILDKVRVVQVALPLDDVYLHKAMKAIKIESESEFIRHIIKSYDDKLLF